MKVDELYSEGRNANIFRVNYQLSSTLNPQPSTLNPLNLSTSLNMYKYLLQSVEGIQWFGIGTLLLFFCTFCFAAIRAFISKKEDMDRMANLPLED
jgi:hypothetical protein